MKTNKKERTITIQCRFYNTGNCNYTHTISMQRDSSYDIGCLFNSNIKCDVNDCPRKMFDVVDKLLFKSPLTKVIMEKVG